MACTFDIEERHRQVKCFWDLTRFQSTAWSLVVNQLVFVCLTYSLLQIHLLRQGHQELNRRTRPTTRRLLPDGDRVIIYRQQCFGFFTLLEHIGNDAEPGGQSPSPSVGQNADLLLDTPPVDGDPGPTPPPPPDAPLLTSEHCSDRASSTCIKFGAFDTMVDWQICQVQVEERLPARAGSTPAFGTFRGKGSLRKGRDWHSIGKGGERS